LSREKKKKKKKKKTILTTHNLLNIDEIHQSQHTLYINKDKSVLEDLLLDKKGHNIKII